MSAPWNGWDAPALSAGFAERVARAASRDRSARRRRWGTVAVATFACAAAVAWFFLRRPVERHDRDAIAQDAVARMATTTYRWPVSPAWNGPSFTFPLEFAPSLPYRGGVVTHMAPEFDRPGTADYWSYVAVWVTTARDVRAPAGLEDDLRTYYAGLCGSSRHMGTYSRPAPGPTTVSLALASAESGGAVIRGTLRAPDCLEGGKDLALYVEAIAGTCAGGGTFVAYALSPRPYDDPIWRALRHERAAFDCGGH